MRIAVIVPCYKVTKHILGVLDAIGPEVTDIFVVDDKCPDGSGQYVLQHAKDPRIRVLFHSANKGVGGAVVTGFRAAIAAGAEIAIKVDGDGQMDARLVPDFIEPIAFGQADYAKGNRFHSVYGVRAMPATRMIGNAVLSFMTKLSSGYWRIFDPTNGYLAIHRDALCALELAHLSERYFFESDLLIKLGAIRAVVIDVPMEAVYGDETSGLKITRILGEFLYKHLYAFARRLFYFYFLRDFNIASLNLLFGLPMVLFGIGFGAWHWWQSITSHVMATTGTVMLAVLPIVLGFQMVLFFISYDTNNQPTRSIRRRKTAALYSNLGRPVADTPEPSRYIEEAERPLTKTGNPTL